MFVVTIAAGDDLATTFLAEKKTEPLKELPEEESEEELLKPAPAPAPVPAPAPRPRAPALSNDAIAYQNSSLTAACIGALFLGTSITICWLEICGAGKKK